MYVCMYVCVCVCVCVNCRHVYFTVCRLSRRLSLMYEDGVCVFLPVRPFTSDL